MSLSLAVLTSAQLFDSLEEKRNLRRTHHHHHHHRHEDNGSLFQRFTQLSNVLGAENKSIFSDNLEHDVNPNKSQTKRPESNREKFGDEFHIFLEKSKKISSNIRSKEQALVTLTDKIQKLIQADNKIKSDVEKYKALKNEKDEITDNIKNYVHKYEGKINSIKSTILDQSDHLHETVEQKAEGIHEIYKGVVGDYTRLQTEVDILREKLSNIKQLEDDRFAQMRKSLVLDDISVKNKLDVNGVAYINKLNTDSIDFGNLRIDSDHLAFNNESAKIMVGNEVITAKEFFDVISTMRYFKKKCGDNLENCRPIDSQYLKKQEKKEIEILENLQSLRKTTNEYLSKRKNR